MGEEVDAYRALCQVCSGELRLNPALCSDCQIWNDARHVYFCMLAGDHTARNPSWPSGWRSSARIRAFTLGSLQRSIGCLVCDAIADAVREKYTALGARGADMENILIKNRGPFEAGGSTYPPAILDPRDAQAYINCVLFLIVGAPCLGEPDPSGISDPPFGSTTIISVQLTLKYEVCARELADVQRWETPYLDLQGLKAQIDDCVAGHESPCADVHGTLPAAFRIIDVQRLCVAILPTDARYVALSYVWNGVSGAQFPRLTRESFQHLTTNLALRPDNLPLLIWDAIVLCRQLGVRYLWVDRLCIVQDDKTEKPLQIRAMDAIYRSAYFTIAAAVENAAVLGLPGVQGRPRRSCVWNSTRQFSVEVQMLENNIHQMVNRSAWSTRGWTFQERLLSRRILYITEFESYFTCCRAAYHERLGQDMQYYSEEVGIWDRTIGAVHEIRSARTYNECIERYTSLNLSFMSDILNAFAGISNVVSTQLGTELLFGLPERDLLRALQWVPKTALSLRHSTSNFQAGAGRHGRGLSCTATSHRVKRWVPWYGSTWSVKTGSYGNYKSLKNGLASLGRRAIVALSIVCR